MTTILAISGSLRTASANSMQLRAAKRLAPRDIEVELRYRIISSRSILIASPEYAHGVSGLLTNALDWMVGSESFVNKPVGPLNASPRASVAQAALRETLVAMSARVIPEAYVTVGVLGSGLDEEGVIRHPEIGPALVRTLRALKHGRLPAQQVFADCS